MCPLTILPRTTTPCLELLPEPPGNALATYPTCPVSFAGRVLTIWENPMLDGRLNSGIS